MINPRLGKLSMTYKITSILPNPDNKDNIWKDMTLELPTIPTKILVCIPIDRYKKIGTICIKDTCLQILVAAARYLQS
jgi:hypothetical protein